MKGIISKTLQKINIELSHSAFWSIFSSLLILNLFLGYKLATSSIFIHGDGDSIVYTPSDINLANSDNPSQNQEHFIYASSRGKKYYFYNCKSSIKEENKIYFSSESEAQSAGYSMAKTCE